MHFAIISFFLLLWSYFVPCANQDLDDLEDIQTSRPYEKMNLYETYEYGQHVFGEILSFEYLDGLIPAFHPIAVLNASSQNPKLRPEFTYLRVDYKNSFTPVKVFYDPKAFTINIHVKYPFIDTIILAKGYSLPKSDMETRIN